MWWPLGLTDRLRTRGHHLLIASVFVFFFVRRRRVLLLWWWAGKNCEIPFIPILSCRVDLGVRGWRISFELLLCAVREFGASDLIQVLGWFAVRFAGICNWEYDG